MNQYNPAELIAMSDDDIARHLSRGFGPEKFTKMMNTIRALVARSAQ